MKSNNPRIAILGASTGYSAAQLKPFLISSARSIPNSTVHLFRESSGLLEETSISKYNQSCKIHIIRDNYIRDLIKTFPKGRKILCRYCLRLGSLLQSCAPQSQTTRFTSASFGVAIARYFWYRDWFSQDENADYEHVILADTRDVIFQNNPYDSRNRDSTIRNLFTGIEIRTIKECPINSTWYRIAYGSDALESIGDRKILCSGVTGGTFSMVKQYVEAMCNEVLRIGNNILLTNGFDQAVHNHILASEFWCDQISLLDTSEGTLATLHYFDPNSCNLNSSNVLEAKNGRAISIVHQYDRYPDLEKSLLSNL